MADHDPGLPFEKLLSERLGLDNWIVIALGTVILGTYVLGNQIIAPWVERKVMARMQGRRGPVHVGKFGLLQIPADLLKLVLKEDIRPAGADRVGFFLSVMIISVTAILSFAPLPWGSEGLIAGNMSIGILYIFALFSIFPPAMMIGGWASNSKYSLLGGFRSAGQLIAYEIPMFIAILGVIGVVGSFSLVDISNYQMGEGWFLFRYWGAGLAAGFVFFLAGYAETERIPFDIPEDEATLVMGPRTEFTGWRYALIMMVEYLHLFINSLLFVYLFLGGYDPIPIASNGWTITVGSFDVNIISSETMQSEGLMDFRTNPFVQFLALTVKVYLFVFIAAWLRSSLGRLRIDQLLSLGWKILLPIALVSTLVMLGLDPIVDVFSDPSETGFTP